MAAAGSLTVTSKAFDANGAIPIDNTCDGADRSPPLTWSAPPPGTKSLAIEAHDPDAPSGDFTHWIVYNLRPDTVAVPEAVDPGALDGATGVNSFNRTGYAGPCPPRLELHRYVFRVFALDTHLDPTSISTREALDAAMSGHVLALGTLVGTFSH